MDHGAIERELAALAAGASRDLDRECDLRARQYIARRVEPQFTVASADFAADPYLICADRFWNLKFTQMPTLATAVDCAGWIDEHVEPEHREAVSEKWAMGYAFITRDSVESAGEIADATADILAADPAGGRAYFAVLYHAGKLRANLRFDDLYHFLDSSLLSVSISRSRWGTPLFVALQSFAALGSRTYATGHARTLFDRAWSSPERTRETVDVALNGLAIGLDFEGRGELLRARATEAVAERPGDHMFHFRLAIGLRLSGEFDAAFDSVDTALRLLPAIGWRGSQNLLLEQYTAEREKIRTAQDGARQAEQLREFGDQHRRDIAALAEQYTLQLRDLSDSALRGQIRSVELVSLFAAVIAFAVGSLNITLNGNLGLAARLWMIAGLGGGLAIFALIVVGGTWLITRRR
ncbi:hypothetical protein [Nocardia sp. NPDC051570]|uniref:hypothetical protein n=1 Tax=Nocardia sp. NPDC051570 TaxID=3364324 RepID=UPI003796E914